MPVVDFVEWDQDPPRTAGILNNSVSYHYIKKVDCYRSFKEFVKSVTKLHLPEHWQFNSLSNYSERKLKTFFHIVFLEICKSFELLPKGLSTKKRLCFGKPSEELEKEWRNGIDELDGRCRDLLLQEHCKKLFNLMDIFWCDIKFVELDITWLLKS